MERWMNKTAVVTGASVGIGCAVSIALANAGLTVVGLARRPELIDDTMKQNLPWIKFQDLKWSCLIKDGFQLVFNVSHYTNRNIYNEKYGTVKTKLQKAVTGAGRIHSKKCDVSIVDEIQKSFKWVEDNFGGVDVLVNNAGVLFPGSITDIGDGKLSDTDILAVIDINVKGLVMCTRYSVASMKKRSSEGHIININSIAGHYIPFGSDFNVYPSSKHAVTAFTTSLLSELAYCGSKIKVTSLSPGLVDTAMAQHSNVEKVAKLQSSDIADTIIYLLSTPPHVNISELTIMSTGEKRL